MRRLVIDASVLLAAPVGRPDGSPSMLIEAARSGVIEMIGCESLFREFERGLENRYFRERILSEERALLAQLVRGIALLADEPAAPPRVVRDPADDYLVALARATDADAIVTGDRDLLDHEGLDPPAISAGAACEALGL